MMLLPQTFLHSSKAGVFVLQKLSTGNCHTLCQEKLDSFYQINRRVSRADGGGGGGAGGLHVLR